MDVSIYYLPVCYNAFDYLTEIELFYAFLVQVIFSHQHLRIFGIKHQPQISFFYWKK